MSRIDEAFKACKREWFLPESEQANAHKNIPLPIGHGQTNSQPETVSRMLEWLDVQPGDKVLDVGAGSGWTSALIAHVTGQQGMVYAVEKIPELVEFGHDNCKKAGVDNVSFHKAGQEFGLPKHAPYDKILVSAAADELPDELLSQLNTPGRLVIPVKSSIFILNKNPDGIESREYPGFAFVPLV